MAEREDIRFSRARVKPRVSNSHDMFGLPVQGGGFKRSGLFDKNGNVVPTDYKKIFAPAVTAGSTQAAVAAMDSNLSRCGHHKLIDHAIGLGMGLEEIAPQFLGYQYLAGLSQNPLIRAGVITIADEMTKKWIKIKRDGSAKDEQDEKLQKITAEFERLKVKDHFNIAAQKCGFDGGCLLVKDTGARGKRMERAAKPNEPHARIKKLKLVECLNLYPGDYDAADPLSDNYFIPKDWLILGQRISASRVLYFAPNELNVLYRPAYNFFGIGEAQLCLDAVAHYTKNREAAARLLNKFSLTVFKSNMQVILNGGASENFDARMEYFTQWRDNDMIIAIDKELEDIVKLETPLSGITDLVEQALELVAAIFRIPYVKFLGISPAGLNATGEADLRNFYDHIAAKQEKIFRAPLEDLLNDVQMYLFGEIDPSIGFEFNPLTDEDDTQRAQTAKLEADTDAVYVSSGILTEEEVRTKISNDPDSPYAFIKPKDVPPAPENGEEQGLEETFKRSVEVGEGHNAADDSGANVGVFSTLKRLLGR